MIELMTPAQIAADPARWLTLRRQVITASDVASICGVPGRPGPAAVYWHKIAGQIAEEDDNIAMRVGRVLEQLVIDMYAERNPAAKLVDRGLCVHDRRRWQACTFDRIDEATGWPIEAKTSVPQDGFGDPPHGKIPARMLVQTLWQCDIAGAAQARLPVLLLPHGPFKVYWIDATTADAQEDLAMMRERVLAFIRDHLEPQKPPPVSWDERTTDILKKMHVNAELDAVVTMPNHVRDLVARSVVAKVRAKHLAGLAENVIRERLGPAATALDRDGRVIAKRSLSVQRRVNVEDLRERFPDAAQACTTEKPTDSLRVADYWKELAASVA